MYFPFSRTYLQSPAGVHSREHSSARHVTKPSLRKRKCLRQNSYRVRRATSMCWIQSFITSGFRHAATSSSGCANLAWAAGFVDGEGCVSIVKQTFKDPKRRPIYRVRLQVAQSDLGVLKKLQNILGVQSSIAEIKWRSDQNEWAYSLIIDGGHAMGALLLLEPFLRRKKHQACACFDFWEQCEMGVHPGPRGMPEDVWKTREECFKRLKRMK